MKTADETLIELCNAHENKYVSFPSFVENEDVLEVFDLTLRAMEIYAIRKMEDHAIKFQEWINAKGWKRAGYGLWYIKNANSATYSTNDIYLLFISQR